MILQIDLATHTTLAKVRQFLQATPQEAVLALSRAKADWHVKRRSRWFSY